MIRNIVFDMGGVLLTWDPPYIASKIPVEEENRELLLNEIFKSKEWGYMDKGTMTETDFLALVQSRLPESAREDARIAMEEWDKYMEPINGMLQLDFQVKSLKGSYLPFIPSISLAGAWVWSW